MKAGKRNRGKGSHKNRKGKANKGGQPTTNGNTITNRNSSTAGKNSDSTSKYKSDHNSAENGPITEKGAKTLMKRTMLNGEEDSGSKPSPYCAWNDEILTIDSGSEAIYTSGLGKMIPRGTNVADPDHSSTKKSISSLKESSHRNSSRRASAAKERTEICKDDPSSFNRKRVKEGCPENVSGTFLLSDDPDDQKYMFGNDWSSETKYPFEVNSISQFGLELNDNRKLSESFKSPFYKYYGDSKVEDLKTVDFSKMFAEHDETLLYIFHSMNELGIKDKSSKELTKKGWKFDSDSQRWITTREATPKGNKSNGDGKDLLKSKSNTRGKARDSTEIQRWKFDIDQWNLVPLKTSESNCETAASTRLGRIDSPTD
ncbi:unnamed protein product [Moneuplotes crassus]|uniref:NOT2/NOT3/NOT5 C-terminal domain-containing protein n=1 Tax=Euplotes crassus TaxID=5936 RepID=A0AAD1UHK9_EUPCR|nr:unnamed protein product [Moneuplotes crassus]